MVTKVQQLLMLQEKILWNKRAVMEENASANEFEENLNLLVMIIKTTDGKNKTVKSCNSNSYFYSLILALNLNLNLNLITG